MADEHRTNPPRFTCPGCGASHDRGYVNGVDPIYRCLHCGYSGHGFHPDQKIDREIGREIRANQAVDRELGLGEGPFEP